MQQGGESCAKSSFWGELICQLRAERGLSQRRLADEAMVNRSTLRRIEDGTARGDIDVIERLLAHLGYELEALERTNLAKQKREEAEAAADPVRRSIGAMSRLLNMSTAGACS